MNDRSGIVKQREAVKEVKEEKNITIVCIYHAQSAHTLKLREKCKDGHGQTHLNSQTTQFGYLKYLISSCHLINSTFNMLNSMASLQHVHIVCHSSFIHWQLLCIVWHLLMHRQLSRLSVAQYLRICSWNFVEIMFVHFYVYQTNSFLWVSKHLKRKLELKLKPMLISNSYSYPTDGFEIRFVFGQDSKNRIKRRRENK